MADCAGICLSTTYFYGIGSDRPLDLIVDRSSRYYLGKGLGSTTALTDAAADATASYRYDAYGNLLQAADTMSNPLRYTASVWDATAGLVYDRARFYDPSTGRFLTPDPAGCGRGSSCGCRGGSSYAYANDNPVNRVDPTGLVAVPSHLFDGIGGSMDYDLASGVGLYGPRWEIWASQPSAKLPSVNWNCVANELGRDCTYAMGIALMFLNMDWGLALLSGCEEWTPPPNNICDFCAITCSAAFLAIKAGAGEVGMYVAGGCGACILLEVGAKVAQCSS